MQSAEPTTRFRRLALSIAGIVTVLLASHAGEFWPFSILPMFSGAGRPWMRVLVRDVSAESGPITTAMARAGTPFPLASIDLSQNDLAKLVLGFGDTLDPEEASLLSTMFATPRRERRLLLVRVTGSLEGGKVSLHNAPFAVLDKEGVRPVEVAP